MAKKYLVKWDSIDPSGTPIAYIIEFEDVQFKDHYIEVTDDDTKKNYIIPYRRIYDIEITGEDDVDDDFGHP